MAHEQNFRSIKWRAVFAESAFIGASIIIAFALQDWDEDRDIEERTLIALCNVKLELAYNRTLLKKDYIPRQKGMLAIIKGAITQLNSQADAEPPQTNLEQMLLQESLRYSAWTLAGESGYLLHANFELATDIGALFDYQEDTYQSIIVRVNDTIYNRSVALQNSPTDYYVSLNELIGEWVAQTKFLEGKYEALFARSDFIGLDCQE